MGQPSSQGPQPQHPSPHPHPPAAGHPGGGHGGGPGPSGGGQGGPGGGSPQPKKKNNFTRPAPRGSRGVSMRNKLPFVPEPDKIRNRLARLARRGKSRDPKESHEPEAGEAGG